MTRLRTLFAVLMLAVLVPATLAACGSSSSSNDEDPQQALKETFNNPKSITSGNLDLKLSADVSGDQSGSFTADLAGPFQGSEDKSQFPELDLTAKVSGSGTGTPGISFEGGLIVTKDAAFVSYQGTDYEVPSQLFQQFTSQYAAQAQAAGSNSSSNASSLLKQYGIDPANWLTNVSNDGTEDVGGVTTIHISGDADVGKIVSDFSSIASQVPGASAQVPSADQLSQVEDAIKKAQIDVYTGESDHLLRKLVITLDVEPPASASTSGISSVSLDFSIELDNVNEPQTIEAPANAKPLSDLTGQLGGLGLPLGSLGSSSSGSSSTPSIPSTGGSSGASSASQQYIQCALDAQGDQAKINQCAQQFLGK